MNPKEREQREMEEQPAAVSAELSDHPPGSEPRSKDDPEVLRRDIERTREELGETVEALSHKADVKAQVAEKVDERKADLRERGDALKAKVSGARERASSAAPDDVKRAVSQVAHTAEQRPFPAIAVAVAVGILVGWRIGRR